MSSNQCIDLISAVLRGNIVSWPPSPRLGFEGEFLHQARYHGVAPLLNDCLSLQQNWPNVVVDEVRRDALAFAIWELRHQDVLARLIAALSASNVIPVLFKGTALAYDLYADPILRVRGDSDLLVPPLDLMRCREVLTSQGFKRVFGIPGEHINHQETWELMGPEGGIHMIDLHRRINSSEVLSRLFSYEEIYSTACPLSHLSSDALRASRTHALVLACMHRAVHKQAPYYANGISHYGGDRLIWLYDIHLLINALTEREWEVVLHIAQSKGLNEHCFDGLICTQMRFNTRVPDFVLTALSKPSATKQTAIYLNASTFRRQLMDFAAVGGITRKLAFLKELLFPPKAYMHRIMYAGWLPYLYFRRATSGVAKALQRNQPKR